MAPIVVVLVTSLLSCHIVVCKWNGVGSVRTDLVPVPSLQKLSRAQLEFSLDLYKSVASRDGSNTTFGEGATDSLVLSPYSVMSLLSMLYLGSSGVTSEQLRHALHFDNLSYVEVHRSYKKMVEGVTHGKMAANLTLANKMFLQKGVNVSKVYGEKLLEYYDAALELVDFAGDATFARDLVNTWVKVHTRGKIEALLDAPPNPDTKLLLANAIYFQGFWLYRFDRQKTYEHSTFRVTATEAATVPMMVARLKAPHGHSEELKCSALELPYVDRRLSMFILLPDAVDGLGTLEGALTSEALKRFLAALEDDTVNVRIPRFRLESKLWLRDSLVKLGLDDLFVQGQADLSGLTSDRAVLYVNEVTHRSSISVTEEGSEAAAASSLDVERIGVFGESYFEADHPFLFFIWDHQINVVLFIGRVVRPTEFED